MFERPVEGVGTLGREKINALATAAMKRLLHELSSDTDPSVGTVNHDHREMRLNDAIALHLCEPHDTTRCDCDYSTNSGSSQRRPSPFSIGRV